MWASNFFLLLLLTVEIVVYTIAVVVEVVLGVVALVLAIVLVIVLRLVVENVLLVDAVEVVDTDVLVVVWVVRFYHVNVV